MARPMADDGLPPPDPNGGDPIDPRAIERKIEELEARARRIPEELARRADEAIARRAPGLAPSRLRSRMRRRTVALLAMLGVMAALASMWAVLRETTLLREAIVAQLADRFGAEVTIERCRWDGWDRVVAEDIRIAAPGWPAEGAEVARIRRAEVVFAPMALLGGEVEIEDMELDGLTIRLVERADEPGDYNVLALRPDQEARATGRQPRNALLREVRVEFGVLRDGRFDRTAMLDFEAAFEHDPADAGLYRFRMTERAAGAAPTGTTIRLSGTWDERTLGYEAALESIRVDDRLLGTLPLTARQWARRAGLEGRIESATIAGDATRPVARAQADLRDVRLRERDAVRVLQWGRMTDGGVEPIAGDLSVQLGATALRLDGNAIRVTARDAVLRAGAAGDESIEVPVEATFDADLSAVGGVPASADPSDDWVARALAVVPFRLDLRVSEVDARPTADGAARRVELPIEAARAVERLGISDWVASVSLRVERRPLAAVDAAGAGAEPIRVTGELDLTRGRIAPADIPVVLEDASGRVLLGEDDLRIRASATTAGSGRAAVDARFAMAADDPTFELHATVDGVRVDAATVAGLPPAARRVVRQMLDDEAWQRLHSAGLAEPSTRPGGTLDANIEVSRSNDGNTRVSGTIGLRDMWLGIEAFPYPLCASGTLSMNGERVELPPEGILLRTAHGGNGRLRGHVELPEVDGKTLVRSYLTFAVDGERVNRTLLACLPPSFESREGRPEGWPGAVLAPTAEIILGLGLEGRLSATGTVRTRADESDAVVTRVEVLEGRVRPTQDLGPLLRRAGLAWPGQMPLDDVHGVIEASSEMLAVRGGRARLGSGVLTVEARFPGAGADGWLAIDLADFPFERDLVRIVEGEATDAAVRAWDAYEPAGAFDGEVRWLRRGEWTSTWARARPQWLRIASGVTLDATCGDLIFHDGALRLEDFDLRGTDADGSPLRIEADGTIVGPFPSFWASVHDLSIASPLVHAAVRAAGLTSAEELLRDWRPDGRVDCAVSMPGPRLDGPWEVSIAPQWIAADHKGRHMEFLCLDGDVVAGPAGARAEGLTMALDRGLVRIDGEYGSSPSGGNVGLLAIDACVAGLSPGLRAVLPAVAVDALEAIRFDGGSAIWADRLRIMLNAPATGEERVTVTGPVGFAGASFATGVQFSAVDGTLDFDLTTTGGRASGTMDIRFPRLDALGRSASDVAGILAFDGDTGRVRLEDLEANLYGGRVAGRATLDPADDWRIELACANVGFGRFVAAPGRAVAAGSRPPSLGVPFDGSLSGRIALRGSFGDRMSQRGTGRVTVGDARMMEFPLGMSLLQITQLMLPLSASMDSANAEFDVIGDRLTLERFDLASGTLRLEGSGEIDLDDGAMSLRMRNRGRFPIISDLYGVVTDQVFAIDVGGTIADPQPRLAPMPTLLPRTPAPNAAPDAAGTARPEEASR
ncbi:MAG: hypothetical protein RI990_1905 [Planctomycetota bacterium]